MQYINEKVMHRSGAVTEKNYFKTTVYDNESKISSKEAKRRQSQDTLSH